MEEIILFYVPIFLEKILKVERIHLVCNESKEFHCGRKIRFFIYIPSNFRVWSKICYLHYISQLIYRKRKFNTYIYFKWHKIWSKTFYNEKKANLLCSTKYLLILINIVIIIHIMEIFIYFKTIVYAYNMLLHFHLDF